jgi:hypothetical protein
LEIEMSRLAAPGLIFGIAVLGACGSASDTIVSPPPATMSIVGGNNQSANVRASLSEPLVITVTTPDGAGVPGVTVEWTVTTGGGRLSATSVLTDDHGLASVIWILGDAAGNQSVAATGTGLVGSPANFSAIARAPLVLHYDGTAWTTVLEDVNGARASLRSIWGATASAVFAVGGSCNGSLTLQYGTAWSQLPPSCVGTSLANSTSVWGSSASEVFATYIISLPPREGGNILHYDGQQWRSVYALPCPNGILCPAFKAVWSSSPSDAFAVSAGGMIGHYDGTDWNLQASGTTGVLNAVWGVGPAGAVFTVGGGGAVLYYDRSTWRAQTSGTTQPLYAVWGTSASDVFAVGEAGTILHYDGTAWTAQNSGTPQPLYGIWGSSSNAVFAVGGNSTILHYDGTNWTAQTTSASMNLLGVWGSSPTNVFAVGAPR